MTKEDENLIYKLFEIGMSLSDPKDQVEAAYKELKSNREIQITTIIDAIEKLNTDKWGNDLHYLRWDNFREVDIYDARKEIIKLIKGLFN